MKTKQRFNSIEDYIDYFPEPVQVKLDRLRTEIHQAVPNLLESISYQMPTFELNNNKVHFAAYKNHIAVYPGPEAIDAFKDELGELIESKGTIRIPIEEDIPYELLRVIIQFALKENFEEKAESNKRFGDNKAILMDVMKDSSEAFLKQLQSLDEKNINIKIHGVERSPLAMLKHQIAWLKLLKYWDEKELKSEKDVSPKVDYKYHELTYHYQNMYKQYEENTLEDGIEEYESLIKIYETWIESLSEEELFTQGQRKWTGDNESWPIAKWIHIHVLVPTQKYTNELKKLKL